MVKSLLKLSQPHRIILLLILCAQEQDLEEETETAYMDPISTMTATVVRGNKSRESLLMS